MVRRPFPAGRLPNLVGADRGLTTAEAGARRDIYGFNDILATAPSPWRDLARDTARDPMIWFLLGAGVLFALLGDYVEALTLGVALVPLVGMDSYLHHRTLASTQGLASRLAARAQVFRDGHLREMPSRDIVPGDLVHVSAGDIFPADGVIVAGESPQVDESSLTGESQPIRKRPTDLPDDESGIEAVHWAFAGTRVLSGEARVRIAHTGRETQYGAIVQSALAGRQARTPLQTAIAGLVTTLVVVALIMCLILAAVRLLQGHGLIDAILSAVTLAVAALPEEFPVVFTLFLGVGVFRLARRQALVRRAVAVENIGRTTSICTDKTGTLTEGRLTLQHSVAGADSTAEELLRLAALAANHKTGDPLDVALAQAAPHGERSLKLASFPFTEDRRRETAIVRQPDETCIAIVKGAPETILALCLLNAEEQAAWQGKVDTLAASGHKVIACATRELDESAWAGGEPDRGFRFRGLLAFEDRVRHGVAEAILACRRSGIHIVMVTGDHPVTAAAIAREIGIGGGQPRVATAQNLGLDSGAPPARFMQGVDVVARAAPGQKLLIVRSLQAEGHIVAVTGDGVNDVPALQAADIGIAMGERGTRSAREVAAIVLLDDNFRTIVHAIAEGRQLFHNLQLSFAYLLMVHIPLVLSATVVPLAGYPLLYLPIHIVWLEMIIHPTALLVFQNQPPNDMLDPAERDRELRFFRLRAWCAITCVSAVATVAVVFSYVHALTDGHSVDQARAMALAALIMASAVFTAALGGLRSKAVWMTIGGSLGSLVLLVEVSSLARLVHLELLNAADWGTALAAGAGAGIIALFVKHQISSRTSVPLAANRNAPQA